jgi:DNA-binding beta-propeller fold protein YncE
MAFALGACRPDPGLLRPNGVGQASDGSLYILDFGNYRVVQTNTDGKILNTFGSLGTRPDQIFRAYDMAINSRGELYFGNMISNDDGITHDGIKAFTAGGNYLREIGGADYPIESNEPTYAPYGIDIDQQDRLYSADYNTGTLRVFDPEGALIAEVALYDVDGNPFSGINDVAVDDTRGLLYGTQFDRGSVGQFQLAFGADGKPIVTAIKRLAEYGRGPQQVAFPQYLAVSDATGLLYVGDMANRRIQIFDSTGAWVGSFQPDGVKDWQNMGLNLTSEGNLLVADAFNNSIWIFTPQGEVIQKVEVHP